MNKEDTLTELIRASGEGPLPWGKQKQMVNLFMGVLEDVEVAHNVQIEKLKKVIQNLEENNTIVKELGDMKIGGTI